MIWNMLISWLGLFSIDTIDTSTWTSFISVEEWWEPFINFHGNRRKCLLAYKARLSGDMERVQRKGLPQHLEFSTMPTIVVPNIKAVAILWSRLGQKNLSLIMLRV
jgi:hypothetical protein